MSILAACNQLSAGWAGRDILSDLDLQIDFRMHGQCLPIVGKTGIGKSTLLYALSGMARPSRGTITWHLPSRSSDANWHQVSWSGASRKALAGAAAPRSLSFGFLLQDAAMISCFTIQENLAHAMQLRGLKLPRAAMSKRIRDAVAAMAIAGEDVDMLLQHYPNRLSGGQRQRMALAAATVHDPTVLFADEPTASLDEETGFQVLRSIRHWLDAADVPGTRAFVFVTHSLRIIRPGLGIEQMLRLSSSPGGDRASRLSLQWDGVP